MHKVKLKIENGLLTLILTEDVRKSLEDNELLVQGVNGYKFVDPLVINLEVEQTKPMSKAEKVVNVEEWIEEYRELFPKGMNSNGYPYRGEKLACLGKMKTFVRNYDYTKEEIINATKIMINRFKQKDYEYMMQAHYFIEKNKVSSLKQFCDMVREGVVDSINPRYEKI